MPMISAGVECCIDKEVEAQEKKFRTGCQMHARSKLPGKKSHN